MKTSFLSILITVAAIVSTSCDSPQCKDNVCTYQEETPCGTSQVLVTYEQYSYDATNEFVAGKVCIGTNTSVAFTLQPDLTNIKTTGTSYPQTQENVTNCFMRDAGSYSVVFDNKTGFVTPPISHIDLSPGSKITVFGHYGPS